MLIAVLRYISKHSIYFWNRNCSCERSDNELDDLLLAVYSACLTGQESPDYGDLVQESVDKGVDTAIGFRQLILDNQQRKWGEAFWYYLLDEKVPVTSAATLARVVTVNQYGDAGGMDSYRIEGDPNLVINYPRAGTLTLPTPTATPTPTVTPTGGGG